MLFTLLVISVGAVSAADNNTNLNNVSDSQYATSTVSDNTNLNLEDPQGNQSNVYYVGGNTTTDGDGSVDNPYNNLNLALNSSKSGDTIIINDGIFSGENNTNLVISKSLTIKAAEGATPTFNGQSKNRIFVIRSPNVTLDGLTFINGNVPKSYGGALLIQRSNLKIRNCTFRNCYANAGGAVFIYPSVSNTVFKDTCIERCQATYGGGVYLYDSSVNNTVFDNTTFRNCYAAVYAAAIYNKGSNTKIINSTFNKSRATYGGSIFNDKESSNLLINGSSFNNNVADDQGGAIYAGGSTNPITIVNSNFTNNIAYDNSVMGGGALLLNGIGNKIINSTFSNNMAYEKGGAILFTRSNNSVINCTFDNNSAVRGGAIAYRAYVDEAIENNTIIGSVFTNNGKDVINNTNSSFTKGGAVYAFANNTQIINSSFDNNSAIMGGAVLFSPNSTNNNIESSNFTNNKAVYYNGGAVVSGGTNDSISDSKFINNTAQNYGGAISMNNITVVNSTFENNNAKIGSTIYSINSTIVNSSFSNDDISEDDKAIVALNKIDIINSNSSSLKILSYNNDRIVNGNYSENQSTFDNGYLGYCAEQFSDSLIDGVVFDNYTIFNRLNGEDISDLLKILVYEYYNGTSLQSELNILTDGDYLNSNNTMIQDVVSKYNSGLRINSSNNVKVLDNGTFGIYDFKFLITPQGTQNSFLFRLSEGANETVVKETLTPVVFNGNDAKFNITVMNNGNCNLTGIFVRDNDFSNGLIYKSFESTYNWVYNPENNTWILNDTLEPNQTADLTIIFTTSQSGVLVNNVSSGVGNYVFSNSSNNTTAYTPNMTVVKIANNPNVFVGNLTSFTIVVTNTGDYNLTGVYVVESNYTGLNYVGFNGDNWVKNDNVFTYLNTLGIGQSANFTVIFNTVKPGNYTNIVIAGSNETVNITTNNTTSVKENKTDNNTNHTNNKTNKNNHSNTVDHNSEKNLTGIAQGTPATGLPIVAFLIALLCLLIPRRRK
ncbi:right-handed parallel beta-helix repeat-containing protein [Methanobrevibacter sp. AbM4]|uniref:right-handed parallel beta-helix repeat-containing protein n=2 Tax=Methanobrevibacter TaxID=2172 RepID=UPI000A7FE996|nr:right-handed parallel beta-helix repeat-containing protein [Methanobrevibacter sp. AbM4]